MGERKYTKEGKNTNAVSFCCKEGGTKRKAQKGREITKEEKVKTKGMQGGVGEERKEMSLRVTE